MFDAEDASGAVLAIANNELSPTHEAVVPPETTGRRSMTSETAPTAFMKSSCEPLLCFLLTRQEVPQHVVLISRG